MLVYVLFRKLTNNEQRNKVKNFMLLSMIKKLDEKVNFDIILFKHRFLHELNQYECQVMNSEDSSDNLYLTNNLMC